MSDSDARAKLQQLKDDKPKSLLAEFWDFIVYNKAWWMTPIVLVLLAMVAFILFAEASPVLPFIYTVM